jgi:hypothetical protein
MAGRTTRVATGLLLAFVLVAAVGCAANADTEAKAQYDRAATYLQSYSTKTEQISKSLLAYKQQATGPAANVRKALPLLDETDKTLASRAKDLALAKAALAEAAKLNVSDESRKLGQGLSEIVVIATKIDAKIAEVVAALRASGNYYASGGKDPAKLKALTTEFEKKAADLQALYTQFDKKRAEVGALVNTK